MPSIWIQTGYCLAQSELSSEYQTETPVALMSYADSKEEFEQRVSAGLQKQTYRFRAQLAPLPLSMFLERHGHTWLMQSARGLTENEVRLIHLGESEQKPLLSDTDYLLCHQIKPVTLLDRQFGRHPKRFAPDEIAKLLFPDVPIPADMMQKGWEQWPQPVFPVPKCDEKTREKDTALFGEPLPPLKCYAVLDANKYPFLQPERFSCRIENLFQGEFGEETQNVAPYLVEVIPYGENQRPGELMGLFSETRPVNTFNWADQSVIFIHSRYDFDTVLHHFRRFPLMKDENDNWFFFRFYDPKVLRDYLEIIRHSPEKLSKFFGYDKRIVHAFGSGIEDSFHYYQLKALPEETVPAKIMLAKWEMDGFRNKKWLETRENLAEYILATYPQIFSAQEREQLIQYLDEAESKGYMYETAIVQYVVAKQSAVKNGKDFSALEKQLTHHISSPLARAEELFSRLNLEYIE
ncbi:DUF4123 domain-containing protein [Bisgaard Taxon 10/6]|uniref:DUF4123 domain-containing protein n=1 Tax=Exercitatus varius TaxID=67857 RepID=UPI00294B2512|nr:DUF4123 domain-containing protein [Exercitatus varius]MDG2940672.1 DUF4123 domain-containing protein [Exercitatus varius]